MFNDVGYKDNEEESYQSLLTDYGSKFSDYLAAQNKDQSESGFTTAYRLTGECKIPGTTDFLETLIENNCKFLVFGHH